MEIVFIGGFWFEFWERRKWEKTREFLPGIELFLL
jgi:hypothetical protein